MFDGTDHLPTFVNIPLHSDEDINKVKISFRDYSNLYMNKFVDSIATIEWDVILQGDVDFMASSFNDVVSATYCSSFPVRNKLLTKKRLEKPWLTPSLLKLIKQKAKYFKLYKQGLISEQENKTFKNKLTNLIRTARKNYKRNVFRDCNRNLNQTWKNIKNVLGLNSNSSKINMLVDNDVEIVDGAAIASAFIDFFLI